MKFVSEEAFTDAVIDLAKMSGWLVHHDRGRMKAHIQGHAGFPDLVLVHPYRDAFSRPFRGRVIFAELKMPAKNLEEHQHEWIRALCMAQPLDVEVWRPDDWDKIVETLTGRRP